MTSEAAVAARIQLALAYAGCEAWRNNSGCAVDASGRTVRYGLANTSAAENTRIKSSDFIGITPRIIAGERVGVFTAIETKHSGWHLTPSDKHGQAQAAFHAIVRRAGGYAGFVTCETDLWAVIGGRP